MPPREPSPETHGSGWRAWVLATRPAFISVSVVGCLLGMAYSRHTGAELDAWLGLASLTGAVLVHAGVNVLNDYYDALNGTDDHNVDRLYPFTGGSRFIQNNVFTVAQTRAYGFILLAACATLGSVLCILTGWSLALLGAMGIFLGWAYSAPPLRLNSRGLGEICVGLGFGILIPLGADLVQQGVPDWRLPAVTLPFALLVTNILYLNQFPDRRADQLAGKRHLVVRLGARRARWLYLFMVLTALGVTVGQLLHGRLPSAAWFALLPIVAALWAAHLLARDWRHTSRLVNPIKLTIGAALGHGSVLATLLALTD